MSEYYIQEVWAKKGNDRKFIFLGIDEFEFDWYFDKSTKVLFDFPQINNVVRVIQYKAPNQKEAELLFEEQQKKNLDYDYFAVIR
jgi:hypothetical protein